MAITWNDDVASLNACENKSDWSSSGFANPDDNNSGSATPIYREGTGCMQASAAKGTTGYWYDSVSYNLNNLGIAVWIWFSGPLELSYFGYFSIRLYQGTNWVDYDFLPEMQVLDVGGWFSAVLWPTPSSHALDTHVTNSGTPSVTSIDEFRIRADQTDANYDVKLVGWDYIHQFSYIRACHDEVGLEDIVSYDSTNNYGLVTQKGTTFQAQVLLEFGGQAGSTDTTANWSNQTLTFRSANQYHAIGFSFRIGGTNVIDFNMTDMVFNWSHNAQAGGNYNVFRYYSITPSQMKIDGCQFNNHPEVYLPGLSVVRWVKTSKFNGGREIKVQNSTFEDNTVSNAGDASTSGGLLLETASHNCKRNKYLNNYDAIHVDVIMNLTLDGDTFSGNTYDIKFSANMTVVNATTIVAGNAYKIVTVGTTDYTTVGSPDNVVGTKFIATGTPTGTGTVVRVLLVQCTNGANATTYRATGTNGDVLINNPVTHRLYGLQDGTEVTYTKLGTAIYNNNGGVSTAGSRDFSDAGQYFGADGSKKGHLLVITNGADAGRYYVVNNSGTTLTLDTELTTSATALIWRLHDEADNIVVFHEESSNGDTQYQYNYEAGLYVDILIFHTNYDEIEFIDLNLPANDADVPVQQSPSGFYYNPP